MIVTPAISLVNLTNLFYCIYINNYYYALLVPQLLSPLVFILCATFSNSMCSHAFTIMPNKSGEYKERNLSQIPKPLRHFVWIWILFQVTVLIEAARVSFKIHKESKMPTWIIKPLEQSQPHNIDPLF